MITVDVIGIPAPQGSKRAFVNPISGRVNLVESSAKVKPWREAVRSETQRAMQGKPGPLADCAVRAVLHFTLIRPKSLPRRYRWPWKRPDLDKLVRATLDGLNMGGAFHDDAQICHMTASKSFGEMPGCWITLEEML